MTKVTLNCGSITEDFSLADFSRIIKLVNLGLTYMYSHPKDFEPLEEDYCRELRSVLVDFYDDVTYGLDECPEILAPEVFSRSDYEHDIAVDVDDLPF